MWLIPSHVNCASPVNTSGSTPIPRFLLDVAVLQMLSIRWRERNQQGATNPMFIIKLLSQHVSGIIMPIIRRIRPCTTAYGVLHLLCWLWLCGAANHCRTPYAVVHGLILLMMGIMMPETFWDRSLIINIGLVASCWFLSLHPTFMMHGHKNLKLSIRWQFVK